MKRAYFWDYPGSKAYFTEADASSQHYYGITFDELDLKLKLWLLLADHVILSTGHMLESPVTFRWLTTSPDVGLLADDLALLPSLREDRASFEEYVLEAPEWEDKPALLSSQEAVLLERAKKLQDIFKARIAWSPGGESTWFRDSLVQDLTRRDSPLRRRLVGVPKGTISQMAGEMANSQFLTRQELKTIAEKHCPQRQTLLCRYGDLFYYFSGAAFKDADPILHSRAATLCREEVSYEIAVSERWQPDTELWRDILDTWQVSARAIKRLNLGDIASIRRDSIGVKVRKTWKRLTDEARQSGSNLDSIEAFNKSKDELLNLLSREMARQQERHAALRKARGWLEVIGWVTSGFGTLAGLLYPPSLIVTALGIVGLLAGKPILDKVEKRTPGAELIILSARVRA